MALERGVPTRPQGVEQGDLALGTSCQKVRLRVGGAERQIHLQLVACAGIVAPGQRGPRRRQMGAGPRPAYLQVSGAGQQRQQGKPDKDAGRAKHPAAKERETHAPIQKPYFASDFNSNLYSRWAGTSAVSGVFAAS